MERGTDQPRPGARPGRRARTDVLRNRRRILDAATELLTTAGPDVSLEAVARHAGVGSATVHRHFRGRRALLAAVYDHHVQELARRAGEIAADVEPSTALAAWLAEVAQHCLANLPLLQLMQDEGGGSGSWQPLVAAGQPLWDAAVRDGSVDPQHSLEDLLVLVNAVVESSAKRPERLERLLGIVQAGAEPRSD